MLNCISSLFFFLFVLATFSLFHTGDGIFICVFTALTNRRESEPNNPPTIGQIKKNKVRRRFLIRLVDHLSAKNLIKTNHSFSRNSFIKRDILGP